ncbi:MAG TPA: glutaredoxin, partial [Acholeplasmataceae bacterium]|nr:glutaredoxin [Acholeplasmataceae bacterium]
MKIITGDAIKQITDFLEHMVNPVHIKLFITEGEPSDVTKQLLEELTSFNNKLTLETFDFSKNNEKASEYGLTGAPSFVLLDDKLENKGILYSGIPLGHEINSLLSGIIDVSGYPIAFDEETLNAIKAIDKEVSIKVFVTMSCPYCPGAVSTAHRLALLNPNIKAEMVDAQTFNDEAVKYDVTGVPKIVFNNNEASFLGDQPVIEFINT